MDLFQFTHLCAALSEAISHAYPHLFGAGFTLSYNCLRMRNVR